MTYTLRFLITLLPFFCIALTLHAADPTSSPEQEVLDRFIGKWRTEYTHRKTEWTPVAKAGGSDLTFNRVLAGQFVQERGTHDDKKTQLSMYTYDEENKCYRLWWFSSTGQTSESTGEWDAETKTLKWVWIRSAGQNFTMTGSHHFVADDVFEWEIVAKDKADKILFHAEGKATRMKQPKK